jgi:hypothetical protein
MYAAPSTMPVAPRTAQILVGSANAPTRIVHSPVNPLPGISGIPIEESVMTMKITANHGMTRAIPP